MVRLRSVLYGGAALAVILLLWEGYKLVGSPQGWSVNEVRLLPRADDSSMPHVWTVAERFTQPEISAEGSSSVLVAVLRAAWFSFRISLAGWLGGVLVGVALAVLMQRFRTARDALLPYVVISQTVPLVAIAPVVVGWGGQLAVLGQPWQPWMSVAVISGYLAFFPVAVGMLRGLDSPGPAQIALMQAYAASWWQTLVRLRLPASVGHLVPALRLAAAASVIGTIVAEISTGTRGGIGRLIIEYAQAATGDPARPWTAIAGAAALGLVVAALVSALDLALARFNPAGA
ncbi:ABC transporter permease [Kineosporia babensis]|uniref:ABC transporter permease subunit n=1 Tax=Kineosporia babensis TaxID=499548 RepID=A0A9X1NBN5_9ACTN|nr:ABC transporter permease subunit [Kineosporia babensis]